MTEKHYGMLGTFIIHNIIVLILLFTYITLTKPSPSEGGILINFGDVESAGGPEEPALSDLSSAAAPAPSASQPKAEDGMLTQDFEEAPAVKKPAETKKTEKKPETKPVTQPVKKPAQTTTAEPAKPTVNKKALYSGQGTKGQSTMETGTSEGIYKGSGNMGDPTGTPDSDNYSKGLGGDGIAFDLKGRRPSRLPEPEFNIQKQGKVIVEITVDRSGKVIKATPGFKGSTLVDKTLWAAAKKAALQSTFNEKNDAPEGQVGYITYHFKLQ